MPTPVSQITTYAELKTAIADWLDRSDHDAVIPLFTQLAEKSMEQKLRHHKMVIKSFASGVQDDPTVVLPPDWLEARNLEIDDVQITYQSPDVFDLARKEPVEDSAAPSIYTFYGSTIEVWRVPTADYTIEMDYYQKLPPLAGQINGRNWLLDDSPGAYLYGSLIHAAPYLRDDPRIAIWQSLYRDEMLSLQDASTKAMTSGSRISRAAQVTLG
jgi:hypothetical protein